jgi:hypothetical protein
MQAIGAGFSVAGLSPATEKITSLCVLSVSAVRLFAGKRLSYV